jgi:hypothetical protein
MNTKCLRFLLITIVFTFFFLGEVQASHFVGCDISYKCTDSANVYKVTAKMYTDCNGLSFCNSCSNTTEPRPSVITCTTNLSIVGLSPGYLGVNLGVITLSIINGESVYDIVKTCPSVSTVCNNCKTKTAGTFSPGVEVFIFEGNVNLSQIPSNCCKLSLQFGDICCSAGFFYTTMSLWNIGYVSAELDRCQSACNSAPVFTNDPVVYITAYTDFKYNLGAIDIDGDSLSYAFGNYGTNAYNSPYSATYPFPYYGAPNMNAAYPAGLRINPITGDLMFRPMGAFVSRLFIEVTQWKLVGGIRINVGKTKRDMLLISALSSNTKTPKIKVYKDGQLQFNSQNFNTYIDQQFCLDIVTEDQQDLTLSPPVFADTTDMNWNNPGLYDTTMANATFTRNYILANRAINGPKADSFKFCWTPNIGALAIKTHQLSISGTDRNCPVKNTISTNINFNIVYPKSFIDSNQTKKVFCNNRTNTSNLFYQVLGVDFLSNNIFTVQLSNAQGSFSAPTTIGNSSNTNSSGVIVVTIPANLTLSNNYKIRVLTSSSSICELIPMNISIIAGFNYPVISSNLNSICKGSNALISATPNSAGLSYKWLKNNTVIANETKDSLLVDSAFTYRAIVSNTGCSDTSNAKTIVVHAKPTANFTSPNSLCFSVNSNVISLVNTSTIDTGSLNYNWKFSDGTNSNLLSPTKTINAAINLTVKLIAVSNQNCSDSILKTILVSQKPNSNFTSNTYNQCRNNNIFTFVHDSIAGNNYSWNFGDSTFASNATPIKNYLKTGSFSVSLIENNSSGCSDTTIKTVNVYPNPMASFQYMAAREQCLKNNNFVFSNNSTIENGTMTYKWVMGENDTIIQQNSSKTFSKKGRYDIYLYCTSNHNCTDLKMNDVTVYNPKIDSIIGNKNPNISLIPYTYSVSNQPSVLFDWTITNGVILSGQGTNSVSVIWSSTGKGLLKARINEAYTCYDSIFLPISITNVAVNNLSLENDLKVFPNPTESVITISNKNNLVGKNYIIQNLVGQTLLSGKLNLDETIVNIETLQSGMYFLSIDGMNKQSIKIIKQ